MKRTLLFVFALVACILSAQAQFFTTGNLAVVRVGGAGQFVSSNGIAVNIDQYTTSGTLVNTVSLPASGSNAFVLDNSTAEGTMTLSANDQYLVLGGYNSPVGSGFGTPFGLNGTTSTAVSRSIGTIDGYGNFVLQITNDLAFTTWPISSAVFDGTNNFWMEGENSTNAYEGVIYVGSPASPTAVVVADTGNEEAVMNFYNGSLFIDSSFSPNGIYQILNTNVPVAPLPESSNYANLIIPLPTASRNKDFVFDPGMTTCYYADSSIGIVKFTNNAGTWVSNYTIPATNSGGFTTKGALALTADWTQSPVVVYATTAETTGNRLIELVDAGPSSIPTMLAQAFTNHLNTTNVFRGVRFAPSIFAPEITTQPASVVQSANGSATFTVTALGSPTLSYQWYVNGAPMAGANESSLTLNNVTTFQSGTVVDVVVTNGYGAIASSNATLTVNPIYFMGGNLAVVSVGGPGQFVGSSDAGNTVSILQFTPGGTQVSTLNLPSSGPTAFALDGSATEGFMTLTANGQYLVLGGYNTIAGTANITGGLSFTTSTNVPRAVVTIDGNGNYSMPIANTNVYSTFNIRGAVFDGTNNFWVSGSGAPANPKGIFYVGTPGSIGANSVSVLIGETGTGNERVLNLFNNTLYIGTGSATHGIWALTGPSSPPPPIGLPTNAPINTIAQASSTGPYDFAFDSGNTTCYVADGNLGGIIKYTNNAGTWVSNYLIAVGPGTNVGGLTVDYTQKPPVLYATTLLTGAAGNQLISLPDNGPGSIITVLATASATASGSNYFRGVRFVPGEAPVITTEPAAVVQAAGGNAIFTVEASGTPAFTYQWFTNGAAVAGATGPSFTLTDVALGQSGTLVSAVVSNNYGFATSSNALLTVQQPNSPFDVTIVPPTSVTVNAGGTASFSVSAVGADITYYWSLNGVPLVDGGSISGSSTATLTISPAFATYNGTYTVLASNSFGTLAANNSATLKVIDPIIVTQPVGSTNLPGASATLSVAAVGVPTLTYQWLSNGVPIGGANASTLVVANNGTIASGLYSVIVSNGLGNFTVSAATTVSFTPVLLSDTFSYPNGNLFGDPGSPWTEINGTAPLLVTNGRAQINQDAVTSDAQSLFSIPESGTVLWASFIVNVSTLPSNPGGVYFANFEDTNFDFFGKIFSLTSNNPSLTPNIANVAFPGTYRLGISGDQADSAPSAATGPAAVVPLDLAPGIDYQVVVYLDLVNDVAGMAVNPASVSDVTAASPGGVSSGAATDGFTPTLPMSAFGLRERTDSKPAGEGVGVLEMDNLVVSFDWSGTGTGYPVVTSGITASNPVIGLQPVGTVPGTTNFSGSPLTMEVAASGIGAPGVGLTYAWYQNGNPLSDGVNLTGSATPTLTIGSLVGTNSGNYYVLVTGATGTPVQTSNAVLSVDVVITAPFFTLEPAADTTNSQGGSVTFTTKVGGTGPLTFQWFFSNSFGLAELPDFTNSLTLSSLSTNQSGDYYVVVTGGTGLQTQSSNALLTVTGPKVVTIGYLRSLLNPATYQPSDTTTFYTVTGVITTATNLTSGDTSSYYLQDSTGGINLFVTFGADFRPTIGDEVTATGVLSSYVDNYELDVSEGSAGYTNYIVGTNFPMPTPILFPWGNDTAPLSPFLSTNVEGSVVLITNLYFEAYAPGAVFAAGIDYVITNNTGETYTVFVDDQDTNYVVGKPIPQFATSIAGPLVQDDATIGIEFTVYSNLVVPVTTPTFTVAITNPPNGATFTAPANVNIAASATVSTGTITNVEFLANGTPVGAALAPPFSVTATNLTAGNYVLTAVASSAGYSATSSVVTITVTSSTVIPPLTNVGNLSAAVTGAGGTNNIILKWTAAPSNYTYSVWFTTNLLQPFSNLVSGLVFTNTIGSYTDVGQTISTKFYEIVSP
jgi:hypothetical protein